MDDLKLYGKSENQVDILVQSVWVVSEDVEWNLEYKNVRPGREEKETCQVREYCHPRWKTAWFEQWIMVMWMLINTKGAWGRWN